MEQFISDVKQLGPEKPIVWSDNASFHKENCCLPSKGRVLVLAPHPDDPESVAITSRLLLQSGCEIAYTIVTLSPNGVTDPYAHTWHENTSFSLLEKKKKIRIKEQICAAEMMGVSRDHVRFLDLQKDDCKKGLDTKANIEILRNHLESEAPDIVMLPSGKDTNTTHVWVYNVFRKCAKALSVKQERSIVAFYNEDPKTIQIQADIIVMFDEKSAAWKRELLKTHDSQQQRNLHTLQMGFDERILRVNLLAYNQYAPFFSFAPPLSPGYAEIFELELFEPR